MKSQNKTDTVLSGLIILIIYLFIQFVSGMIGGIKKIFNLRTISLIVCLTVVTYNIPSLISSIVSFISPASDSI